MSKNSEHRVSDETTSATNRRATIKDVATAASVSVQTVSNYINARPGRMNSETEARVRRAITDLGYRPNSAAQGLRSQSRRTLAFVINDSSFRFLGDPMTDLFLAGLGDELRERDFNLLIDSARPSDDGAELTRSVGEGRADAAVVFLSGESRERRRLVEQLAEADAPVILLQEHRVPADTLPSIVAKDMEGSKALCRHLIDGGHERIAFLTANQGWSAIEERILGYQAAHKESKLVLRPEYLVRFGDFKPLDAAAAAARLLDSKTRPTAIMCGNDLLALGVVKAARDQGLRIPEELAVTGFDDFDFAVASEPSLSTVRVAGYEMGRFAAQSLIRALASDSDPVGGEFDIELCLRAST